MLPSSVLKTLKLEKARIIEVIDESKRGYKAVQVGFGSIKTSKISKAIKYNPDFLEIRIDYLSEINIINLKKILKFSGKSGFHNVRKA